MLILLKKVKIESSKVSATRRTDQNNSVMNLPVIIETTHKKPSYHEPIC